MKKNKKPDYYAMAKEYKFENAVRGKYTKLFKNSQNYIILDPDVAPQIPNAKFANTILRYFLETQNQLSKKVRQAT